MAQAASAAAAAALLKSLLKVLCILLLTRALLTPRACAATSAEVSTIKPSHGSITLLKGVVGGDHEEERVVEGEEGGRRKEKYIWPLLSDYVGAGNQLMEYMSAAVVAHALNRTLCLTPFHDGPAKHNTLLWRQGHGLAMEERYSVKQLSKFVRVASVDQCLNSCNHKLDATWFLKGQRLTHDSHFDKNTTDAIWSEGKNMKWSFVSWTTTEDVRKAFGESDLRCVALGGLFPGLRWRGAYLAVAAYLKASHGLAHSATTIQTRIIGPDTKYLAVHWRFEESFCGGRELGSCFLRCGDGAIVNTGLHPLAREWIDHSQRQCHFHGVKVTKEDVVGAIYDRAIEQNLSTVYLATDGWIRGQEGALLIKQVVEMLREKNITIVGLWRIKGLPNFPNGDFLKDLEGADLAEFFGLQNPNETVSGRMISGVEQELCNRAEVFLGSGQSTWSLAVFRSRLAHRRARAVLKSLTDDLSKEELQELDQTINNQIIEELLGDEHEAGLLCGYHKYYNTVQVNATKETSEDEAPDGWLDLEACEMRIGHKGGQCEFATCT